MVVHACRLMPQSYQMDLSPQFWLIWTMFPCIKRSLARMQLGHGR